MSLLTEKGTGHGSRFGNVTIRAWLVLLVVLTACVQSTILLLAQIYCAVMELPVPVSEINRMIENIAMVMLGWYFNKPSELKAEETQRGKAQ